MLYIAKRSLLQIDMGCLIALDFGLKRTGIAITDSEQRIASPLCTVPSKGLMKWLIDFRNSNEISGIVLGFPVALNGAPTHVTENVCLLKEAIEKELKGVSVEFQDERFSSKRASNAIHQMGKRKLNMDKSLVDKVSAAIILQDFLNARENS